MKKYYRIKFKSSKVLISWLRYKGADKNSFVRETIEEETYGYKIDKEPQEETVCLCIYEEHYIKAKSSGNINNYIENVLKTRFLRENI